MTTNTKPQTIACTAILCLCAAGVLAGPFTNGSFEDPSGPLTGWQVSGAYAAVDPGGDPPTQHAIRLVEDDSGGLSRIYQVFDFPNPSQTLAFRYRLAHTFEPRTGFVPPDSFTAFLVTNSTLERVPGILGETDEPTFSSGFFYTDSDGIFRFDSDHVTVAGPDGSGMYGVLLDLGSGAKWDI
jgi:hypothetical protein